MCKYKSAKTSWLKAKYVEMIDKCPPDMIEVLFEEQIKEYPDSEKAKFRTALADHL